MHFSWASLRTAFFGAVNPEEETVKAEVSRLIGEEKRGRKGKNMYLP